MKTCFNLFGFPSLPLALVCAAMALNIAAQERSLSVPAGQNPLHWVCEVEPRQGAHPAEIMRYYHAHQADFAGKPRSSDWMAAVGLFRLAEYALRADDEAYETLLKGAESFAEMAAKKVEPWQRPMVTDAHERVVLHLCFLARYAEAAALIDRSRERSKNSTSTFAGQMLARSVGDFAEVLRLEQEALSKLEKTQRQAGINPEEVLSALLPNFAKTQAEAGELEAAKASLSRLDALSAQNEERQRKLTQYMPPGIYRDSSIMFRVYAEAFEHVAIASVLMLTKEPEKALKHLEMAEECESKAMALAGAVSKQKGQGPTQHIVNFTRLILDPPPEQQDAGSHRKAAKGRCLLLLGRGAEAEQEYRECLKLRALKIPQHRDVIEAHRGLAWALLAQGKTSGAAEEALKLRDSQMQGVKDLLSHASERQRMAYLQQSDPFSLLADTGRTNELASAVLRLKGLVLDSVLEEKKIVQASSDGEAHMLLRQLNAARQKFSDALLGASPQMDSLREDVASAEFKLASFVKSQFSTRSALAVTQEQIQECLQAQDALVDFIRYRHMEKPGAWKPHYGALMTRRGQPVHWIDLGDAETVDLAIGQLLGQMKGTAAAANDEVFQQQLRQLFDRVLAPLIPQLGDAKRLLISPDGNLSTLSFAVLLAPDGRFAAEKWDLSYISSARDLLREVQPPSGPESMTIIAAPDFDAAGSSAPGKAGSVRSTFLAFDRQSLPRMEALPGTLSEMKRLQDLAVSQHIQVTTFSGAAALDSALQGQAISPTYLHLATHGLILPPSKAIRGLADSFLGNLQTMTSSAPSAMPGMAAVGKPNQALLPGLADDPLQRSVLALAGVNATFAQWKAGEIPPTATDGVLTAAEVAAMDLSNTWLAVLSACETAAGDALSGEGVMGMRRGFFLAGVDHLVMTFWPIADEETVQVMADFYKAIGDKAHPATALHRVQRDALVKWRKEKGLQAAVFLAGPFALSTSGKLPPN